MLRLERMQVAGFKSFSDRTQARFPDGITAVVGPNGCGKSNLGDAINWVLGEQSPKNLRGKQMQDVIFSGSKLRKPKGLAEVSLHLANPSLDVPEDQRRVVITRRLFRSGESEYLINGKRSRLRDIQDILRSEHVGAKTYATIEQGRIDQILNAKPKERRLIIEDAAGVSGFKHKRRLAELKMEATQANLLRVSDIIQEVTRQINSLKRQAAKARRYKRLREDLRTRERIRFAVRSAAIDERLTALRSREAEARDAEAVAAAELARLEATLTEERLGLENIEREHRAAAEEFHHLEIEIDRGESRIQHCRERIADADDASRRCDDEADDLDRRLTELRERITSQAGQAEAGEARVKELEANLAKRQVALELAEGKRAAVQAGIEGIRRQLFESMSTAAELRNRRRAIEEAFERHAADRDRIEGERSTAAADLGRVRAESTELGDELADHARTLDGLGREHDRLSAELEERRRILSGDRDALSAAREEQKSATARLRTLEDVSTRFAGVSDGVRMLLTRGGASGLRMHGVVADFVEAGREVEGVAEEYLQRLLPAVILEDDGDARTAADLLRSEGAGRTTFVSRSQPVGAVAVGTPTNGRPPVPDHVLRDPRVRGRLSERLVLHTRMNGVLQDRIGDAILVDTLASALDLHREYPGVDYLTGTGEVVYASGLVTAGKASTGDHGLLAHNRRMQETQARLDEVENTIEALQLRVEDGRGAVEQLETRLERSRGGLEQARQRTVELELRSQRSDEDLERSSRRTEILQVELESLIADSARLEQERSVGAREVEHAEDTHRDIERRLADEVVAHGEVEATLGGLAEQVSSLRADLAAARQRLESEIGERERLEDGARDLESRVEALRTEGEAARERSVAAAELLEITEHEMTTRLEQRAARECRIREAEAVIVERRRALGSREAGLRDLRSGLDESREASRVAEMDRSRAESERGHLDEMCVREIGVTAAEARDLAGDALDDPELDLDSLESDVEDLKRKIESIGPVNMMAIDEFSELDERHGFLTAQRQDLDGSMASLKDSIRKINRESRERFLSAFESIRENYREIFKVLFHGGRADLRLDEEEDDVLEAGIEILAQPPGKRLGSVQLLSGGEKAMSAIALLFAIFRYQPSPFCLLDEVDAALDDVNVGRFTRMLREYASQTQFIMITHNKVSMESADLLYGVTMEEPGVSRLVSLQIS